MSDLLLEEISPRYLREKRLDLTLDDSVTTPSAFNPVLVNVSYARTLPDGILLPLILEVQGPSPQSYQRREYTTVAPDGIIFTPREGGVHLVVLREVAHNRFWGSLRVDVAGELLRPQVRA